MDFCGSPTYSASNNQTRLSAIVHEWSKTVEAITASINDTAKALSLGRTSIYALIREGRLETIKLGRRTLIKVESIRKLIERQ